MEVVLSASRKNRTNDISYNVLQASIYEVPPKEIGISQFFLDIDEVALKGELKMNDLVTLLYRESSNHMWTKYKDFIVREPKFNIKTNSRVYQINCVDINDYISSFLGTKNNVKDTPKNFMEVIQVYLNEFNSNNAYAGIPAVKLHNPPIRKSNGSLFPNIEYFAYQRPFPEILDELVKNEYTQDGNYLWKINNNNELIIYKPVKGNVINYDLSNSVIFGYEDGSGNTQLVNQVIAQLGKDFNDNPIYIMTYNAQSVKRYGLRDKFIVWNHIAEEEKKIMNDAGLGEDNLLLIRRVKAKGYAEATAVVNSGLSESVESYNIDTYQFLGNIYDRVKLPSYINNSKPMFVKNITHNITSSMGWTSRLSLVQENMLDR